MHLSCFYRGTDRSVVDCTHGLKQQAIRMPYFSFDLVIDEEFRNQGGMILENTRLASEKADCLAIELLIARPELRSRGCAVRVTDDDNIELYRSHLEPIPSRTKTRRSA